MYIVSVQSNGQLFPIKYGAFNNNLVEHRELAMMLSNGIGRARAMVETIVGLKDAEGIVLSSLTGGALERWVDGCRATCI